MKVLLQDGREGVLTGAEAKGGKLVKVKIGDEEKWMHKTGLKVLHLVDDPELEMHVTVSAIERLEEFYSDQRRLRAMEGKSIEFDPAYREAYQELFDEATKEFITKWGLSTL